MAGIKDMDLDTMTVEEVNKVFSGSPFQVVRVVNSQMLLDVYAKLCPKLREAFSERACNLLMHFCKQYVKYPQQADYIMLRADLVSTFFDCINKYCTHPKEREDVGMFFNNRMTMNIYSNESEKALIVMCDLIPLYFALDSAEYAKYEMMRITHEYSLNTLQ